MGYSPVCHAEAGTQLFWREQRPLSYVAGATARVFDRQ